MLCVSNSRQKHRKICAKTTNLEMTTSFDVWSTWQGRQGGWGSRGGVAKEEGWGRAMGRGEGREEGIIRKAVGD